MEERTKKFINKIETLKSSSLIGGWLMALDNQLKTDKDGSIDQLN